MRKLKERFHRKHGVVSRIFSMVLALAMIMTMAPAIGGATTAYAASPTIRLYLDKPSTWNTPVVNVWAALIFEKKVLTLFLLKEALTFPVFFLNDVLFG